MLLKTEELGHIQDYVSQSGLTITDIQEDIVDHLSCFVEEKVEEGMEYDQALEEAQQLITPRDLLQIQEDTIYFLTIKKQIIMIKAIFISGYVSLCFLILGLFFILFGYVLLLPEIIGFALLMAGVTTI